MDRDVDVRTPESISFSYQLAGLGSRFLALTVDLILQILILLAIAFGIGYAAQGLPKGSVASAADTKVAEAVVVAVVVAIVFAILFGYFILFEALWHGQTPGKRLLGIRVVRDGGYPIDFGAALVRNLIRVGEWSLAYLPSAISMVLSSENKRLGDIAAGTIVVRDERMVVPLDALKGVEPVYADTRFLTGDERALVRRFLERRDELAPDRRRALAAQLAQRVRERVPEELRQLDDEPLLERL